MKQKEVLLKKEERRGRKDKDIKSEEETHGKHLEDLHKKSSSEKRRHLKEEPLKLKDKPYKDILEERGREIKKVLVVELVKNTPITEKRIRRRGKIKEETNQLHDKLQLEVISISRLEYYKKKNITSKFQIIEDDIIRLIPPAPLKPPAPKNELSSEDIPYFFDIIFEREGEIESDDDEPIVIYLDDPECKYIGALRRLLLRIYREKVSGKPEATIFTDIEEFLKEERWIEAQHKIFSIELDRKDWEKIFREENKKHLERIWNRIQSLFSQGFGFIIFNTKHEFMPRLPEHIINVVKMVPKGNVSKEVEIAKLSWGLSETPDGLNFNTIFRREQKESTKAFR